jgi:hypothetical protein
MRSISLLLALAAAGAESMRNGSEPMVDACLICETFSNSTLLSNKSATEDFEALCVLSGNQTAAECKKAANFLTVAHTITSRGCASCHERSDEMVTENGLGWGNDDSSGCQWGNECGWGTWAGCTGAVLALAPCTVLSAGTMTWECLSAMAVLYFSAHISDARAPLSHLTMFHSLFATGHGKHVLPVCMPRIWHYQLQLLLMWYTSNCATGPPAAVCEAAVQIINSGCSYLAFPPIPHQTNCIGSTKMGPGAL